MSNVPKVAADAGKDTLKKKDKDKKKVKKGKLTKEQIGTPTDFRLILIFFKLMHVPYSY